MALVFDQMHRLGWRLCARRFRLDKYWQGDLLFAKDRLLMIVETRDGLDMCSQQAARITADMLGMAAVRTRHALYYAHLCRVSGRIRGIHKWHSSNFVPTVFV